MIEKKIKLVIINFHTTPAYKYLIIIHLSDNIIFSQKYNNHDNIQNLGDLVVVVADHAWHVKFVRVCKVPTRHDGRCVQFS